MIIFLPKIPVNNPPNANAPPTYPAVSAPVDVGSILLLIGSVAPTKPADINPPLTNLAPKPMPLTNGIGI